MAIPHLSKHRAPPRAVKAILYHGMKLCGGGKLLRWVTRYRIPILCYHSVVDGFIPPLLATSGLHLSVQAFRKQMEFVRTHYRVVSLTAVVETLVHERPLQERTLALTFDDGYWNNLSVATPVLEEFGLPATVFLSTEYLNRGELYYWDELSLILAKGVGRRINAPEPWHDLDLTTTHGVQGALDSRKVLAGATLDERRALLDELAGAVGVDGIDADIREQVRPLTWDECRARPACLDIGGHSASHRNLDLLDRDELPQDLAACRQALREELNIVAPPVFCYPDGRWTEDVQDAVAAAGFSAAVDAQAVPREESFVRPDSDRWAMPRIGINSAIDSAVFAGTISGIPGMIGSLQRSIALRRLRTGPVEPVR